MWVTHPGRQSGRARWDMNRLTPKMNMEPGMDQAGRRLSEDQPGFQVPRGSLPECNGWSNVVTGLEVGTGWREGTERKALSA